MQRIVSLCLPLTIISIGFVDSMRSAYALQIVAEPGKYISMSSDPRNSNVARVDQDLYLPIIND